MGVPQDVVPRPDAATTTSPNGPTPPSPHDRIAEEESPPTPPSPIAVAYGCHGGLGTSLLARAVAASVRDDGLMPDPAQPWPPVLLTCAPTAHGALVAVRTVTAIHAQGRPVVLAVMEDGHGPLPIAARTRFRTLESQLEGVVLIPWIARWRYEPPDPFAAVPTPLPRRYRRAAARVASVLTSLQPPEDP